MKNSVVSFLAVAISAAFLVSCVSIEDRQMTLQERAEANIVGSVSATFTSFQLLHIPARGSLRTRAYRELMEVARQEHHGNIEIRNIRISGGASVWGALYGIGIPILTALIASISTGIPIIEDDLFPLTIGPLVALNLIGNFQRITVTGDVVLHGAGPGTPPVAHRVDGALNNAVGTLVNTIPQGSTIAILNVHSNDLSTAEFIMVGLEYRLFTSRRFVIVDRIRLDQIRLEQHLHISGEVDDASAVSIGQILGASIVITGSIGDDAMGGWLVLRALDVQTGQVMAMAMQRF